MSFADDALALLEALAPRLTLPRVRGLHLPPPPPPGGLRGEFCALALEDGSLGQSYVLLDRTWEGLTAQQQARRLDALAGQDALAVARGYRSADPLQRTIGFAAMNAVTRHLFDRAGYAPPASTDSIGDLDPRPGETIGMVGHFTPLMPQIVARGARLLVVELRPDLVGEQGPVRVTLDARELSACAKVLATGTLLLNDTLDSVLTHCAHSRRFVMLGPSVGCPPDPLFARGVTLLGGSWVTDAAGFVAALRAGEPTRAFARKFSLRAEDYPGWATLLARAATASRPAAP
ncbi:MAG: DUF364 domain-containing protein [Burkholderiaceae bacterium]